MHTTRSEARYPLKPQSAKAGQRPLRLGRKRLASQQGFSLMEAVVAAAFLGLIAAAVTAAHVSGLDSIDEQADRVLLDSRLRSRMEVLVGTAFGSLSGGSEDVTVNGKSYTIAWTVTLADLNGDAIPEATAKQVVVSVSGLPGRSLTTLVVDHQGSVGKI